MTYVGIDVSKVTFVVAYSSVKTNKTRTFKNTVNGVHEFVQTISASEHNCVLEATGNYSALLVYLLSEAGITISLENPLKIKNFARVMLTVTKTDEIDARLIAIYGEKMQPAPYKLRSDAILVLKQKRTVLRQLKKQLVATRNLKGSMEVLPFFDPKCKKTIEKTITFLEKQIKEMEELHFLKSKSKRWKRNSLHWHKVNTRNRWTCSPPSKASVSRWQLRLL